MVRCWLLLDVYYERLVRRRIDWLAELTIGLFQPTSCWMVGPVRAFVFVPHLFLGATLLE